MPDEPITPAEPEVPKIPIPKPTDTDDTIIDEPPDEFTKALNRLADVAERKLDVPAPVVAPATLEVTQPDTEALKQAIDEARATVAAANEIASRDTAIAKLDSILKRFDNAHPAPPKPDRQSSFSLEDAKGYLADTAGVGRADTKSLFKTLDFQCKGASPQYKAQFGTRVPLDIVMHGAFRAETKGRFENFKTFTIGSDDEVVRRAQELNDIVFIWKIHTDAATGRSVDYKSCPLWGDLQRAMDELGKALDTTDTANWVPTGFSAALLERYELDRKLVAQLRTFQQPRTPFDYPVMGARTTTYLIAENTADPESATAVTVSDLNDLKVTMALKSLGARTSWSYELDEDSIIPIATAARDELAKSMAYSEEQAILDGDVTATHQDSDVTAATDVRKAFADGLRFAALDNSYSVDLGSNYYADGLMGMIRSLGTYGAKPQDLFWVCGSNTRAYLLTLKSDSTNLYPVMISTLRDGGVPNAMTLSEVPMIFGLPVVVSEAVRENLNASGVYDSTTVNKTYMLIVNREGFRWSYTNQATLIESQRWIRTRQVEVVASVRREFEDIYVIASNHTVHIAYNLPTS